METWRWIEKGPGYEAFFPTWDTRDPIGPEYRRSAEAVYDGHFLDPGLREMAHGVWFAPRRPST
jgi:hypothetical protein